MKRIVRLGFLFVIVLLVAASLWLALTWQTFRQQPLNIAEGGYRVEFPAGSTVQQLARQLATDGVLEHPYYLIWLARWKGDDRSLKAGQYQFEPGTTPEALLAKLVAGEVIQYGVTLVEGWTFRQMLAALRPAPHLTQTLDGLDPDAIMERLGHAGEDPEGRFFPDTYHYPEGMSDLDLLRRAYDTMAAHLEREWAGRAENLPYDSPYQALIMASIVEKETGAAEERPAIAGVFVRRLQKGMLLQTDPTVIYGLGESFDGNLRRRDLQTDGPYNTYTRAGLPPTPIAMPGLAAIRAALHPDDGKALYFVARGDGTHEFSETLTEHNRAVAKFQLRRNRGGTETATQ